MTPPQSVEYALAAVAEACGELENARAHRDDWIRRAAERGASYRQIAEVCGLSFQRVAQIVTARRAGA